MSSLYLFLRKPLNFLLFCISIMCLLISLIFAANVQYAGNVVVESKDDSGAAGQESGSEQQPPKQSLIFTSPSPTPEIPHTLVGSYYSLDNNIDAKLLLNNKGSAQLQVQPTLYNLQGQELELPSVTVEPQSFRFIDLQDWAAIGGESFRSGNIKLFHYGKDLVLGAQIYLTDEARSISFEEKLTEIGKFDSRRQEAVALIPTQQTRIRMIFTNTTNAPLSVTATPARSPNILGTPHPFQLAAHETKILDLRQDFVNGNQFADAEVVGLSLEHTGVKDALLARVLVADIAKGYSNVVQFSNPDGGKSSEYQGVGFQIEDVAGLRLAPIIVTRNVGNSTAIQPVAVQAANEPDVLREEMNRLIEQRNLEGLVQLMEKVQKRREPSYNTLLGNICSAFNSHDFKTAKQYLYARNCSKGILSNGDEISVSLEQRMIENLQGVEEYKSGLVVESEWETDRTERIKMLLHLWRRLEDNIERNFDCSRPENRPVSNVPVPGPYLPGVSPKDIKEPEIRAKYEEAIKINRLKAQKCSFQSQLQKLDKTLPGFVESFLIQMYSVSPYDMSNLKKDIDTFRLDKEKSKRIVDKVIFFKENKQNPNQ